jgi:hypothetical protein
MGLINDTNYAFLPVAIGPFGNIDVSLHVFGMELLLGNSMKMILRRTTQTPQ